MWLALASIVMASAIAFNVIALWLTGWFERKQPEGLLSERNTNAELSPHLDCSGRAVKSLLRGRKGFLVCVRRVVVWTAFWFIRNWEAAHRRHSKGSRI
jgi:hypothetical protein